MWGSRMAANAKQLGQSTRGTERANGYSKVPWQPHCVATLQIAFVFHLEARSTELPVTLFVLVCMNISPKTPSGENGAGGKTCCKITKPLNKRLLLVSSFLAVYVS